MRTLHSEKKKQVWGLETNFLFEKFAYRIRNKEPFLAFDLAFSFGPSSFFLISVALGFAGRHLYSYFRLRCVPSN